MNNLVILQAMFSSVHLPGKALKPIMGKPMLALQIERVLQSKMIDQLIVATCRTVIWLIVSVRVFECRKDFSQLVPSFLNSVIK